MQNNESIKIGDRVHYKDNSYCFTTKIGTSGYMDYDLIGQGTLTVVATGLNAVKDGRRGNHYLEDGSRCDLLLKSNNGDFWFAPSALAKGCKKQIIIDGKKIEISLESYQELKRQLL